jgi:ionotropic glutamate receptor
LGFLLRYCGILIPVNDDSANINAVVKPFQWPVYHQPNLLNFYLKNNLFITFFEKVWLGIGVSIVCVTTVLILILRFSSQYLPKNLNSNTSKVESSNDNNLEGQDGRHPVRDRDQSGKQYLYVIGNLLSQGLNLFKDDNKTYQ